MDRNNPSAWFKQAVFYELFVRSFCDSNGDGIGDLNGVTARLDYLKDLGVDTIWLSPITRSPWRDGGYDVSDYTDIHPSYGTMDDFRRLVQAAHQRGLKIVVELIPNHTSDQHPWFQASHDPAHPEHARYRDYYVWSETDQRYRDARIIFIDYEKSNWTYDPLRGAYYWHRFFHHQPDLNFDNPEVQRAMLRVAQFWIDQGVDGIRVDAPPYLFEREGTSCENLPETHAYYKRLRAFIEAYSPGTMLLAEANQWPEDTLPYFGNGDEFQMNFHFPLMPRIFMALAKADRKPIEEIMARTPELPGGCQWGIFLRCHDELTLEMVTPQERTFMWDYYASLPRMRLNLGIRRRLAPLLENDPRRLRLANSILLSLIGTPILYYGDEIGMGDNIWLEDRDGVRTPMQWDASANAGFSSAPSEKLDKPLIQDEVYGYRKINVEAQIEDTKSLLNWTRSMLRLRKQYPAFGEGTLQFLAPENSAILAYLRVWGNETLLVLNNLSSEGQEVTLNLPGSRALSDIIASQTREMQPGGNLSLHLDGYEFRWFKVSQEAHGTD
jgi:maltose alpha-D-glucosyltransferase / alpha-amylase